MTTPAAPLGPVLPPAPAEPLFTPSQVRLGITPTGWCNSDDPAIDRVPATGYREILSEIALAGYAGTQMSGRFPGDVPTLRRELALRGLTIAEPWVGTFFSLGDRNGSLRTFTQQLAFMEAFAESTLVVAELGGAVHHQPLAPLPHRPIWNDNQWRLVLEGLDELGRRARAAGMRLAYHPHVGTGIESLADIERLLAGTDPTAVQLLLDTGHLAYAGIDPLEVTRRFAGRIGHVHLKNIRAGVVRQTVAAGDSFLASIRAGVFTVPGDPEGSIDFVPILTELAAAGYTGWLMVEAEQDPNRADPLTQALLARHTLRRITGL